MGTWTDMEAVAPGQGQLTQLDELRPFALLRSATKIRSFDFMETPRVLKVLLGLQNNALELWEVENKHKQAENDLPRLTLQSTVDLPGHRSDIRALALSSDDSLLLSASNDMIKIWNLRTYQCIRTIGSGYGLCGAFIPGNKHVVIGTKTGALELYSISSSSCVEKVNAHTGAVWSLAIRPDKKGLVSGSADNDIKFWNFELVAAETPNKAARRLGLSLDQTLKMSDNVLCVRYSQDNKFLAVALLDCTIKIFFQDTLKFFLSLYGHKLPVMCLDMSDDGTLLVSGGADKNIKIWGMDFGDCHKSIFAHDDVVMSLQFVPHTHYFFSAGKDKLIKYWDADKFEHIMTLYGHHAEVWSIAIASHGQFLVSGSHDRSIRLWRQTDEPLFLVEERENELEALVDQSLESPLERGLPDEAESGRAAQRTLASIRSGERLAEAIELAIQEQIKATHYQQELAEAEKLMSEAEKAEKRAQAKPLVAPEPANPHLRGMEPSQYLLHNLKSIRSTDLEEALLVLPFTAATQLLSFINSWFQEGKETELCARCLFFLLRIHQSQITATRDLRTLIASLRTNCRQRLQEEKDLIGFNKAAMAFMQHQMEQSGTILFADAAEKLALTKQKKRKRKTIKKVKAAQEQ